MMFFVFLKMSEKMTFPGNSLSEMRCWCLLCLPEMLGALESNCLGSASAAWAGPA